MKNLVIASPSSHFVVITTLVYALLAPIFFEMDNAYGEEANLVVDDDKTTMMTYSEQQQIEEVETECNSPCPSSAEMCIAMCA